MLRLMLSDCQEPLSGNLHGDDLQLSGFSIDSRTLVAGDLYIAISGERFDGHDFCRDAEQNGASALLVDRPVDSTLPQLVVADTRIALGQLARIWAQGYQVPTVAITGSNGKTTVKELVAAILGQLGPVLATQGNLNNDIGVPLTLLRMRPHHQYAVIEIGANAPGEVLALSQLVAPDVAVVNNVGAAHLEGFGSEADVAQAKSEIFAGVSADGWAVINADDHYADVMREAASHCHTREFGFSEDVDVQGMPGDNLTIASGGKSLSPRFALLGRHNRMNALAATAAAQCMDVQAVAVMSGLASVGPVPGRLVKQGGLNGAALIDDTYNANPTSVKAAIDVLAEYSGQRYLVLGDMAELGEDADQLHAEVGAYAKAAGIDHLYTVGQMSAYAGNAFGGAQHFDSQDALTNHLKNQLNNDATVLIKGSRGSRMERIVAPLISQSASREAQLEIDAMDSTEAISL